MCVCIRECVRTCVCVHVCVCARHDLLCGRYFVLARTDPDIKKGAKGLTSFIVDADTPGITKGRKVRSLLLHCIEHYLTLHP